jgi:hypothetical protein
MTLDPDHGFGILSPEDQEKIELILTERSDGSNGAPVLYWVLGSSGAKCGAPHFAPLLLNLPIKGASAQERIVKKPLCLPLLPPCTQE